MALLLTIVFKSIYTSLNYCQSCHSGYLEASFLANDLARTVFLNCFVCDLTWANLITPPTLKQEDGHFLLHQKATCEIKRKDHGKSKHGLNIIIRIMI